MSKTEFQALRIELIRPGPTHGQPLSKLTPYVVVFNQTTTETVQFPLEHWELLHLLAPLRPQEGCPQGLPAVQLLGERMRQWLNTISSLRGRLQTRDNEWTHIRLVCSCHEIASLPLEATHDLGEHVQPLLLDSSHPVILTRESPRAGRIAINWSRSPRVLFIAAAPEGLAPVPLRAHALALVNALKPYCIAKSASDSAGRNLQDMLTQLPSASLEQIKQTCRQADPPFTHVHILAHGVHDSVQGERQYRLALHDDGHSKKQRLVQGKELADALAAALPDRAGTRPLWVSLLTCRGADPGSMVLPTASLAQTLHDAGVAWVLASQLPLTMRGSVRLADAIYPGLFRGEDPRRLLYEARQDLHQDPLSGPDWLSVTAYATFPPDFEEQLQDTQLKRIREELAILFNRAEKLRGDRSLSNMASDGEWGQITDRARDLNQQVGGLVRVNRELSRNARNLLHEIRGSYARNAAFWFCEIGSAEWKDTLRAALHIYTEAATQWPEDAWYRVHRISLQVMLGDPVDAVEFVAAYHATQQQIRAEDRETRGWGLADAIELHLLAAMLKQPTINALLSDARKTQASPKTQDPSLAQSIAYAKQLAQDSPPNSDPIKKIRRKLDRYSKVETLRKHRGRLPEAIEDLKNELPSG